MKSIYKKLTTLMGVCTILFMVGSCSIDEVVDPNGPSVNGVQNNASKGQLVFVHACMWLNVCGVCGSGSVTVYCLAKWWLMGVCVC